MQRVLDNPSMAYSFPSYFYTSEEVYNSELERIFYKKWLVVGHISQLHEPGSLLPMTIGNRAILVTRSVNGKIQAFYNVCTHRGTKLVNESKTVSNIQCPYHAWTFNLDGRLIGCPDFERYSGFKKEDYSLYPVKLQLWRGFIFVNLDPDCEPLESFLGDFEERFGRYDTEEMVYIGGLRYEVNSDWKVAVENGNECYHCPTVHPETLKPFYRDHSAYDQTRIRGNYTLFQWKDYIASTKTRDAGQLNSLKTLGLSESDVEDNCLQMPNTFPNCQFNFSPSWANTLIPWPAGPRKCRVTFDFFAHKWKGCVDDASEALKWIDFVLKQDWRICEQQQAGLNSEVFVGGKVNELENVINHFHGLYLQAMSDDPALK